MIRHCFVVAGAAAALLCSRIPVLAGTSDRTPSEVLPILVRAGDALYGISASGGNPCLEGIYLPESTWNSTGCGAILRFGSDGTVSVVHLFVPEEGARPYALRAGADGTLLGITEIGGAHGRGTSFRFDPKTKHLTVLQSLADVAATPADLYDLGEDAAPYDDGSVLADRQPLGTFVVLANGKPARVAYQLTSGFAVGPMAIRNDGRAVFTVKTDAACDAAVVSVGRDGKFFIERTNHKAGAPECADVNLDSQIRLRVADDGRVYTNDTHRVLVAATDKPFTVLFSNAPASAATAPPAAPTPAATDTGPVMLPESAVIGANGDIVAVETVPGMCGSIVKIRAGMRTTIAKLDNDPLCVADDVYNPKFAIAPFGDDVFGTSFVQSYTDMTLDSVAFMIPSGKPLVVTKAFHRSPSVREVALQPSLYFSETPNSAIRPSLLWSANAGLNVPDFTLDPRRVDIEMRNLDGISSTPIRVRPLGTKPMPNQRVEMTMERYVATNVSAPLPRLKPGRYSLTVRASAALRGVKDAPVAIVNDGAPSFVLITPLDESTLAKDTELAKLKTTFAHHNASIRDFLPVSCNGTPGQWAIKGTTLGIASMSRERANPVSTGFGPRGSHTPGAGDASALATFTALDPITVTFAPIGTDCQTPTAVFAADWDVERYLAPAL